MWATAPKLKEALDVMDKWGFEYKTHAVWDKEILGVC
jgi:N6-adenosine-specific RNA methylase IME4